ncbi:hypothetical protein GZ78_17040 [Endozoicomonas numazuensis]|uniref:Uncharacterized protein n=1 Tax=Endozoicomonas numazuensis TaxID=1137799 RepID=A0A081NGA2_9GAMM|nr:hypothetical protein GZ78_17040 [Endozoicomonas numazuensis]
MMISVEGGIVRSVFWILPNRALQNKLSRSVFNNIWVRSEAFRAKGSGVRLRPAFRLKGLEVNQ